MKIVSAKWVVNHIHEIKLIDVRTAAEFENKNIAYSKNIPMLKLLENPENFINNEDDFYLICGSGGRSAKTIELLTKKGYKNLIQVDKGIMDAI